jgi:hypothetical protein
MKFSAPAGPTRLSARLAEVYGAALCPRLDQHAKRRLTCDIEVRRRRAGPAGVPATSEEVADALDTIPVSGPDRRRAEVAAYQRPFAVLFGCPDSHLAAEINLDRGLGDLFGAPPATPWDRK